MHLYSSLLQDFCLPPIPYQILESFRGGHYIIPDIIFIKSISRLENDMAISTRLFGKSGPAISQVGLGGEGVLRTFGRSQEARAVIEEAAGQGITYFDTSTSYFDNQNGHGHWAALA